MITMNLQELPNDIIDIIVSYVGVKNIARLQCVCKGFENTGKDMYPHTTHVLKYDSNATTLPNQKYDRMITESEFLSRIMRNNQISIGLKNKLRFCIRSFQNELHKPTIDNVMTNEQLSVTTIPYSKNKHVVVQAYAGTGKTKTLVEFAKQHTQRSILYIAYNKELCEDAKHKFESQPNVHVSTIHALAFKDKYTIGNLNIDHIIDLYHVDANTASKMIHEFELYCHKTTDHTTNSNRIWNEMFVNHVLAVTHDAYLKQFQLSNPVLNYDIILLDEVQDCNDCILDIICSQKCMKVSVGDIFQRLYGFRNVDDPHMFIKRSVRKNDEELIQRKLSISFRMGFDVMYHVNVFLNNKFNIAGFTNTHTSNTRIFPNSVASEKFKETTNEQITYLCRFNVNIIKLCFQFVNQGKYVYVYGKTFDFDNEIDIVHDFIRVTNQEYELVQHTQCKCTTIQDLLDMYTTKSMSDWKQRVQLYMMFGAELIQHWETLKTWVVNDMNHANVILSTVHQAKGCEFDNVCLYDDLALNVEDSLYIMYVAMTRAKKKLILNTLMTNYFSRQKGHLYLDDTRRNSCWSKCFLCYSYTNLSAWLDVDVDAAFTVDESEIYEHVHMCLKCKTTKGIRSHLD